MASRSKTLYVGMTSDIQARVWQHKNGAFEGFSRTYKCNRLVWFERHNDVYVAIAREKQIKRWSRVKKLWLVELENPAWFDLSERWKGRVKMYGEE